MNIRVHPFYFPDIRCFLVDTVSGDSGLPRFTNVESVLSTPLEFLELPVVVSIPLTEDVIGAHDMSPSGLAGLHLCMRFSAIDPVTGNC